MSLNTLYGRHLTKPGVGTQIDWSHPLANGLVFAWILNEGSGTAMNLVSRVVSSLGGAATWTPGSNGPRVNIPQAGGNRVIETASQGIPNTNSVLSMVAAGQLASIITSRNTLFGMGRESTALGINIQWESDIHVGAYKASSGPILVEHTKDIDTAYHVFVYTQDPNASPVSIFYVDGLQAATNNPTPETAVVDKVLIGENVNEAAVQNWDGTINYALIYNKVLSPAFVSWLFAEPYAFMLQPTYRRWATIQAGTTPMGQAVL